MSYYNSYQDIIPNTFVPWRNTIMLWETATIAPQVIAHRLMRMVMAGTTPNSRDRKEFTRMGQEKFDAYGESMLAMAMQMYKINTELSLSLMRQYWRLWGNPWAWTSFYSPKQLADASSGIIGKGLAPVHRRVTANAKRLQRVKL